VSSAATTADEVRERVKRDLDRQRRRDALAAAAAAGGGTAASARHRKKDRGAGRVREVLKEARQDHRDGGER